MRVYLLLPIPAVLAVGQVADNARPCAAALTAFSGSLERGGGIMYVTIELE